MTFLCELVPVVFCLAIVAYRFWDAWGYAKRQRYTRRRCGDCGLTEDFTKAGWLQHRTDCRLRVTN